MRLLGWEPREWRKAKRILAEAGVRLTGSVPQAPLTYEDRLAVIMTGLTLSQAFRAQYECDLRRIGPDYEHV